MNSHLTMAICAYRHSPFATIQVIPCVLWRIKMYPMQFFRRLSAYRARETIGICSTFNQTSSPSNLTLTRAIPFSSWYIRNASFLFSISFAISFITIIFLVQLSDAQMRDRVPVPSVTNKNGINLNLDRNLYLLLVQFLY